MVQQKADLQHEEGYLAYVIPNELLPAAPIKRLQIGPPAQGSLRLMQSLGYKQ